MVNIKNQSPIKISRNAAFTLIELLIVISVFIIVSIVIMADFKSQSPKNALDIGADQLISHFRQAQTATFTGVKLGSVSPDYGLFLTTSVGSNNQIKIFADLDHGKDYDVGEESSTNCYSCGTFTLPEKVKISGLTPVSGSNLTIIFSATNTDEIYFNGLAAAVNGQITLINTGTSETKSVNIYYSNGQISR